MRKQNLLTKMFLLFALVVGSVTSVWADDSYTQVTSLDDLDTDATYIIADIVDNSAKAFGALNNKDRGTIISSGLTVNGSTITVSSTATSTPIEFTLTKSGSHYLISYGTPTTYLTYSTGTAFTTATTTPTTDLGKWDISYNETYSCLLINNASAQDRYILRNGASAFSPYAQQNLSSYGKATLYKKVTSSTPIVNALDESYDAEETSGSISYTIINPVDGKSLTASTTASWITLGTVTSSTVPFTMKPNESTTSREGVITLTYKYGDDTEDVATKDVTVTQAGVVPKYAVTIETPSNGTLVVKNGDDVVASGDAFAEGTVLTIEATPARGYSFRNWQAVENGSTHTYTSASTYTMTAYATTLKANFDEIAKYTVTLFDSGVTLTEEYGGEGVTLPSRDDIGTDYTFAGWSETQPFGTTTAPTIIDAGAYHPTANVTLYPVYTYSAEGTVIKYQLVSNLNDVTEGTYVWASIYQTSGSSLMYMPNATTTSNPTLKSGLTEETVSETTYLSNNIDNDMLWDFVSTGTSNQYYIRPHESSTVGFGCTTSTGDKIRIGKDYVNMKWTVAESSNYNWQFKNDAETAMYIAVWNATSWRNYSSPSTNQKGKFYLYKAVEAEGTATYYTTFVTVNIPESHYLSYCSSSALDFSNTEIEAYTAAYSSESNKVILTKIEDGIVPANVGVVLYGTTSSEQAVPVTVTDKTAPTGNEMVGVTAQTTVNWTSDSKYNYILQQGSFYKANGAAIRANRAYLHTTYDITATGAPSLSIGFDEETTSISEERIVKSEESVYYDLSGRRVAQPTKGLYIVNGKKVLVP